MADLAIAEDKAGQASPRMRPLAALGKAFAAEGERHVLWLPAFFGSGIAGYFALTVEPPLWLGLALMLPLIGVAITLRRWPICCGIAILLASAAAGLAAVQEARWEHGTPMLERRVGSAAMTGTVLDIDTLDRGWRVVIASDSIPGVAANEQPRLIRVHIGPTSDRLEPGDRISFKGRLYPVPAQVLPGGRDMQRELYFAGIGAVGYSFGGAHRVASDNAAAGGGRQWLLRLRAEMTRRINAALPGSTGGVASAVITGKRGAMAEEVKQSFRDSGLSHLLAIAGLHLGLVGGFVFFAVRGGLALIPFVALRWPIKKIAAGITLVVLFCYLLISGAAIPTERAFVMNGVVFAAIVIDRLRLSMRICALAAMVVLVLEPASLVGVSFQMSFGAVVALVAVYETWGIRLARLFHQGSIVRQVLGYGGAIAVTTVVATIGTEPIAIYHFHHVALYSPLANVLAVPISGLWTLPWGVVACLLMPFGLEKIALVPMGWGIDATIIVAQWVAALPGNVWPTPRLPTLGIISVALGGCWLCLWQGRWRWWGIAAMTAGLATMGFTHPPDIILGDFGRFLAVRAPMGGYVVADTAEQISRSFLVSETGASLLPWPATGASEATGDGLDCAAEGRCLYTARGRRVALVTGEKGLPVVCDTVDAIVAQVPAGFDCRSKIPVVDRIDSWRQGAIALWLGHDGIAVERANAGRGDRPWVPHPVSARERARANKQVNPEAR
ncbi:MAG TPA: ComEC/Rec2 family competence protein [Stellaceae bacterium]|jgi:competence protein ComEC|nr:ComEC/Rec2 family competence protein [Stellaceae bacterium]